MSNSPIENNFKHHAPDAEKTMKHEYLRDTVKQTATRLEDVLPHSREKALAMTKLEEALMWANAAVARN